MGEQCSGVVRRLPVELADGHMDAAIAASDGLMDFVESMFDVLEREVAPSLLDCSLESFDDAFLLPTPNV